LAIAESVGAEGDCESTGGGGAVTVIVVDAMLEPPALLAVNVYVVV